MMQALRLIALGALSLPALACSSSARPTQAASGGQAGNNGDASAGGGPTATEQRPKFRVIDLLQVHALQSGEDPLDFERSTYVYGFNSDASVVVGVSQMRPLRNASQHGSGEALRWTEASGVVGLGFAPGLDMTDPRSLLSAPYCVSLDGSTVGGTSAEWSAAYFDVFLWTEALGMTNLGQAPGAIGIELHSASSDCGVLVGTGRDDQSHLEAVRWSKSSGWQRLGWLPGDNESNALYASADGASVFGVSQTGSSRHGFRWTEGAGITSLGQLPGFPSCIPNGATRDGRVVVGDCSSGTARQMFRWTEETGMVSLGLAPASSDGGSVGAVSADGAVVVGDFYDEHANSHAFRWTQATGMVELGSLAGYTKTSLSPFALAMNADGTVLVGSANDGKKGVHFRWTEATGMVVLQPLPGDDTTSARGVTPDGVVVAGQSGQLDATGAWSVSNAVVWDDQGVAHSIAESLTDAGIDLNGFHLDYVDVALVAGQTVLYGQGTGTDGTRAWVAWLP